MSIPPISNLSLAASLAGTDRAASAENASGVAKSGSGGIASGGIDHSLEPTEKVHKADLSGDSEADGRQMLDTFERRHRDGHGDSDLESLPAGEEQSPETLTGPGLTVEPLTLGSHLDLSG